MSKEPLQSRKKVSDFSLIAKKSVFRCSETWIFLQSFAFYNIWLPPIKKLQNQEV